MKILKFPNLRQMSDYDCGATAVQTVLAYYGHDVREDKLLKIADTDKKFGTTTTGIIKILKKYKLKFKEAEFTIDEIKKYIRKKIPVILLIQAWANKKVDWKKNWNDSHYVVAIGYCQENIYFEDPSSHSKTYLTYKELEERWHAIDNQKNKYCHYGIAVYGKKVKFDENNFVHMD